MGNSSISEFRTQIGFTAEKTLGTLAKWLRILGFDTLYELDDWNNRELDSEKQDRILLTRTKHIWETQDPDSWALDCQLDGVVVIEGMSKSLVENTDGGIMIDAFDGDNDNDGASDSEDDMIDDADPPGTPGHGTPDWHPKNKK